jgi:hypothetical protein
MKLLKYVIVIASAAIFWVTPTLAFPEANLSSRLSGQILLDVDHHGEAWYVYPGDFHRYYLGTSTDAYSLMKNLSLGISNDNFAKIASSTPDRFKGLILLKTEDVGRAYYVNPTDKSLIYLADAAGALALMRQVAQGITGEDLQTIPIGKIILDDTSREVSRTWQYFGWWGRVNRNYVPVLAEPKNTARRQGTLFLNNTVKVLRLEKGDGSTWYQIDGGQYPLAYINSSFVNAIAQPVPEPNVIIPAQVGAADYWTDVNISKRTLTLYQYDQVIMATYIAVGGVKDPTVSGTYRVWFKTKSTRMTGAPPVSSHEYDLPNVPWVMYYKGSYSIHGTYWHDDFGAQRSAGCTNITQGDAKIIFDLTSPKIGTQASVRVTVNNPGMVVRNHY